MNSAAPPVRQARGRLRGPSSPDHDDSSRTCGRRGGAALAAKERAVREVVHATALPASSALHQHVTEVPQLCV